jgi:ADP-ribose pyrophosphatase YjhB (NUDIX family)
MMLETKSAGGVVLNKKGQVLVVNQYGSSWSFPRGHIEEGESALETAKREIKEESGVADMELIKELGTYKRHKLGLDGSDDKTEMKIITMFLFKTKQEKLCPSDPRNPEALWVDKEKITSLLTHKKDKEFFKSILKSL